MKQFVYLAGMPRSGSTLLLSILNQNPNIFASSSSPLCNMLYQSETLWKQQLALGANPNDDAVLRVLSSMIPEYYADKNQEIIIDKSFNWGLSENLELVHRFSPTTPKFIVMDRNWDSVVESVVCLFFANPQNKIVNENMVYPFNHDSIRNFITAEGNILWKCKISKENILNYYSSNSTVVEYERFCSEPDEVIHEIYKMLEIPYFLHWYTGIENSNLDNDSFWGIPKMHEIRTEVGHHGTLRIS